MYVVIEIDDVNGIPNITSNISPSNPIASNAKGKED
jgi:hypothetical protein